MAAPSYQDFVDTGKAALIASGVQLDVLEGDISEFLMAAAGAMADMLAGYVTQRIRATYVDGAKGDDLTTLADDHWGILRKPATPARGPVTLSRTSANGAPAKVIAAGSIVATQRDENGNTLSFTTDDVVTYALGETIAKTVGATAVATGPASNVIAGAISAITTNLGDSSFTVTNASPFSGGNDAESDDDLKERIRAYPSVLRRATLTAIEFGALQVQDVRRASAVEENGIVTVYVTDESGNAASAGMISDVSDEMANWRAAGIPVNVLSGAPLTQDIALTLVVRAGVDTRVIRDNVIAAVTARVNQLKIGDPLTPGMIEAAALDVDRASIVSVTVMNPVTKIVPDPGVIIRAGTVTVA